MGREIPEHGWLLGGGRLPREMEMEKGGERKRQQKKEDWYSLLHELSVSLAFSLWHFVLLILLVLLHGQGMVSFVCEG